MFMVEHDKQNAAVFQSFVPQWLVSRAAAWFPDLLASICLWGGNSCFFPTVGNPLRGEWNTAVPTAFARDEVSFFVFLTLVKCVMFTLPVQDLEFFSPVCQTWNEPRILKNGLLFWFFPLIYACVSFNLSQFCTFSKYWKCFYLLKFIPSQTNPNSTCLWVKAQI